MQKVRAQHKATKKLRALAVAATSAARRSSQQRPARARAPITSCRREPFFFIVYLASLSLRGGPRRRLLPGSVAETAFSLLHRRHSSAAAAAMARRSARNLESSREMTASEAGDAPSPQRPGFAAFRSSSSRTPASSSAECAFSSSADSSRSASHGAPAAIGRPRKQPNRSSSSRSRNAERERPPEEREAREEEACFRGVLSSSSNGTCCRQKKTQTPSLRLPRARRAILS